MRSARRPRAPDAPAGAPPEPHPRPRRRCRASGRRPRTRPAATRRAAAHDRSCRFESLTPTRVRRVPPELALGLRIRRAAAFGHYQHSKLTGREAHYETGYAPRLLAAKHPRQGWQPLGDRGGIIVDDVVHTPTTVLDRRDRRLRGVGDVDERPHAAAVADQREPTLAKPFIHACAGPVEGSVAQHDALGPPRIENCLLEMGDRGRCLALAAWWRRVERVLLAL